MTPLSKFQIGTTLIGMVDLSTIVGRYTPYQTPSLFYDQIELSNKIEKGIGFPKTIWHWDILPQSSRNILKTTYCPDPAISAVVFINTPDNTGAWHSYQAVMKFQLTEDMQNGRTLKFDLLFERMVFQV